MLGVFALGWGGGGGSKGIQVHLCPREESLNFNNIHRNRRKKFRCNGSVICLEKVRKHEPLDCKSQIYSVSIRSQAVRTSQLQIPNILCIDWKSRSMNLSTAKSQI